MLVMVDKVRVPEGATVNPPVHVLRVIGGGGHYIMSDWDVTLIVANAKGFFGADYAKEVVTFIAEHDNLRLSTNPKPPFVFAPILFS